MKTKIVTLILLFAPLINSAAPVTPKQALDRLNIGRYHLASNSHSSQSLSLKASLDMLYVFSDDRQYIITPADDCAPALLGYGTALDLDDIPPAMVSFLKSYSDQIKWLSQNPLPLKTDFVEHNPVQPLISTQWNQTAPYNNKCPLDGVKRSYTGCVATAMAQIMKYHEWPQNNGFGSHSYDWNGRILSCDFASTKFDWWNMLPSYRTTYGTTQANAVANLMLACGVSVDMDYSAESSGAKSRKVQMALVDYFGYDKGCAYMWRNCIPDDEWYKLMLNELDQGHPIYYSGNSGDGNSGHAFVCDGYQSNGYFHINWGWGGSSDGFFLLSALDPYEQGAGGSGKGYNFSQDAVIGIQPAKPESELHLPFYSNGGIEWSTYYNGFMFGYDAESDSFKGYFNYSYREINAYSGIKLESDNGETFYAEDPTLRTFAGNYGYSVIRPVFPDELPAGTYKATPLIREENSRVWQPIRIPVGMTQYVTVRKGNNGAFSYDGSDPEIIKLPITISDIQQRADWIGNTKGSFSVRISNSSDQSEEFKLAFNLKNVETNKMVQVGYWNLNVDSNSSKNWNLNWTTITQPDGIYTIRAIDANRNNSYISDNYTILIGVRPTSVKCTADKNIINVGEILKLNANILPSDTPFKSVKWTSSNDNIATIDENGNLEGVHAGNVTITATTLNNLQHRLSFTIEENAGIEDVTCDVNTLVDVYNLQGIKIKEQVTEAEAKAGLTPGVYIIGKRKVIIK